MDWENAGRVDTSRSKHPTCPRRVMGRRREKDEKSASCQLQFIVLNLRHFPNEAGLPCVRQAAPPFFGGEYFSLGMRDLCRLSLSVQWLCRNHVEIEAEAKWQLPEESSLRSRRAHVPPRSPVPPGQRQERNRSIHSVARRGAAPIAVLDRVPQPSFSNVRTQSGRRTPRDPSCQSLHRDEP